MRGEFGREWTHVHAWLNPFAVHLKFTTLLIGYIPVLNKKLKKWFCALIPPDNRYHTKTLTQAGSNVLKGTGDLIWLNIFCNMKKIINSFPTPMIHGEKWFNLKISAKKRKGPFVLFLYPLISFACFEDYLV